MIYKEMKCAIVAKYDENKAKEGIMSVCYNKLFKLLIDRKMTNNQLATKAGVSLNIITRLKRDQYIAMDTIEKICIALDCTVDDILEFSKDNER